MSILSRPGTQKQRRRLSIASSDPTPTKRLEGVSGGEEEAEEEGDGGAIVEEAASGFGRLFRRSHSCCFSSF